MSRPVARALAGSPYEAILGPAFSTLASSVQRAHVAPLAAEGTLDVEHGSHWLTPVLVRLMDLPSPGRGQHVRVDVDAMAGSLTWTRQIDRSVLRTRQWVDGPHLVESHGIGRIVFTLEVRDGALHYKQVAMRVVGLVLPATMAPRVSARVSASAGGWHVDVEVRWRAHLVCRYAGTVRAL